MTFSLIIKRVEKAAQGKCVLFLIMNLYNLLGDFSFINHVVLTFYKAKRFKNFPVSLSLFSCY